jgi:hypothetical protein
MSNEIDLLVVGNGMLRKEAQNPADVAPLN